MVNVKAHREDMKKLKDYLIEINSIKPHALIIADAGVLQMARKYTDLRCHISTQTSVTNRYACQFWKEAGASRIVMAREVSLEDFKAMKSDPALEGLELEAFIHGAMCIGYSGKCVISNHIADRDANRGGCIQNCRYNYNIYDYDSFNKGERVIECSGHFMSSKDLMTIRLLPEFIKAGVASLKIEGRMKSNMYVANTVATYREALDTYYNIMCENESKLEEIHPVTWEKALSRVSNRSFTTGNFLNRAGRESIRYDSGGYFKEVEFIGTVQEVDKNRGAAVEVKSSFEPGEILEYHTPDNKTNTILIEEIRDPNGEPIQKARPSSLVFIPWNKELSELTILRREINA